MLGIKSAIRQVGAVLGGQPPFYFRERPKAKNVPHIHSGLLRCYLDINIIKLKTDLKGFLSDFPKLELSGYPYNETVRLPQYKRKKYKIRINICRDLLYSQIAPQVWVLQGKYNFKPSHSFVNDYGVVSVPLLRNWCERYSSLQG